MLITRDKSSLLDSTADLQLERRILNYLYQRLPDLDAIEVETHHGTVVLRGTVPSQPVRWRCVDCCGHVAGVLNVIDRLQIVTGDET